uniref:Uncharacterized protein n=1 Tax=Anguilla anguilla TaxID=7936 RepID=A0A0E9WYQ7_ANGAN
MQRNTLEQSRHLNAREQHTQQNAYRQQSLEQSKRNKMCSLNKMYSVGVECR